MLKRPVQVKYENDGCNYSMVSELGCDTGAELGCQSEGRELGTDTGDETFAWTKRETASARLVLPKTE